MSLMQNVTRAVIAYDEAIGATAAAATSAASDRAARPTDLARRRRLSGAHGTAAIPRL